MVLNMFSKKSVFSLVDILFKDMYEDFRLIEGDSDDEDDSEDEDKNIMHEIDQHKDDD